MFAFLLLIIQRNFQELADLKWKIGRYEYGIVFIRKQTPYLSREGEWYMESEQALVRLQKIACFFSSRDSLIEKGKK